MFDDNSSFAVTGEAITDPTQFQQLISQLSQFYSQFENESQFPQLGQQKSLIMQTVTQTFLSDENKQKFSPSSSDSNALLSVVTFLRLMLREFDSNTLCITSEPMFQRILELYKVIDDQKKSNLLKFEILKLFINIVHVNSRSRPVLVDTLSEIIDPVRSLLQSGNVDQQERETIYFLVNRLVFYALFASEDCLKTWEQYSELIRSFWCLDDTSRLISSRNIVEVLKSLYNLSVHHEQDEQKTADLFNLDCLRFLRNLLKSHVEWTSYKKIDVQLFEDNGRIRIQLKELPVAQFDTFDKNTSDLTLVKHCFQVLMMVPNSLMGHIVCQVSDSEVQQEVVPQTELPIDINIVYGVLRVFFALLDQESEFAWLHTPLLTFLIKACKALPNLRYELFNGINSQDWSIRSFDMALVDALPAKKRKYKKRFGKLNGIPGGLVKDNLERLMTHYQYNFKSAVCQLLFTVCEEDQNEYTLQFGVGNTIGYLSEMGLFGMGQ